MGLHCLNESINRSGRAEEWDKDVLLVEAPIDTDFHFLTQSLYSVKNIEELGSQC